MTRAALAYSVATIAVLVTAACRPTPPQPPVVDTGSVVARCFVTDWRGDAWIRSAAGITFSVELQGSGKQLWRGTSAGGRLEIPLGNLVGGNTRVELTVRAAWAPAKRPPVAEPSAPAAAPEGPAVVRPADPPQMELAASRSTQGFRIPSLCIEGDGCVPPQCPKQIP
jgi:hypothetical protein